MADKLTIKGLGNLDSTYEFDLVAMLMNGGPEALDGREYHRIKELSGVRKGEFWDALEHDDHDFMLALVVVILTRKGKTADIDRLWTAKPESFIWALEKSEEEEAESPPDVPAETPEAEQHSKSGGGSSSPPSETLETGPSRSGILDLVTVTSGQG